MLSWGLVSTDLYESKYKAFSKKNPKELIAVLNNLDKYHSALSQTGNPLQVTAGFIHIEPNGIKALDQKGSGQKGKLKQTRLYIFPDVEDHVLYLLTIGDKNTQKNDIQKCREFVRKLKGTKNG